MSTFSVKNIASLEALRGAMSEYRSQSDEPFRCFAPIFERKLQLLAELEPHFVQKIEEAERDLSSAQFAYSACMSDPNRTSCSSEASWVHQAERALQRAIDNLASYKRILANLQSTSGNYQSTASSYASHLDKISTSIVPNFLALIAKMHEYMKDEGSQPLPQFSNVPNAGVGAAGAGGGATLGSGEKSKTTADNSSQNNTSKVPSGDANIATETNTGSTPSDAKSTISPTVAVVAGGGALAALITAGVVLKVGGKNDKEQVKFLQEQLKNLGYDVDVNGEYDTRTEKAVYIFQRTSKIPEDGKAGEKVWKKLKEREDSKDLPLGIVNKDGFIEGGGVIKERIKTLEVENLTDVHAVVIHRTENNNLSEAINSFSDTRRIGSHFIIDKDGTIYQTASLNKTTQHVGSIMAKCEVVEEYDLKKQMSLSSNKNCTELEKEEIAKATPGTKGWGDVYNKMLSDHEKMKEYPYRNPKNTDSVGIEFIGKFDKNTGKYEPVTKEQAESGRKLVEYLQKKYKDSNLLAHDDISRKIKNEGSDVLRAMGYIWDKTNKEWEPQIT